MSIENTYFLYRHKDGRIFKKYFGNRDFFQLVNGREVLIGTVYNQDYWGFQSIIRFHKVGGNETESLVLDAHQ